MFTPPPNFPRIVCLCGSTKFWRDFQRASLRETLAGRIVLSIGAASGTDEEHFGNLSAEAYARVKIMLDDLHLRKIDLCEEILVLNVGGYIGASTTRELTYAREHGKRVRWLEPGPDVLEDETVEPGPAMPEQPGETSPTLSPEWVRKQRNEWDR